MIRYRIRYRISCFGLWQALHIVTQAKILKWMRMINAISRTIIINPKNDEDSEDFELKRLVQALVDSMEFTVDELKSAVHSIPTPSGCASDSGTSLREAI